MRRDQYPNEYDGIDSLEEGPCGERKRERSRRQVPGLHLGHEEFGIRVQMVREIVDLQDITAVPQAPAHVKGVINLHGKVIPVVDLRLEFNLPDRGCTQRTCVIVIPVWSETAPMLTGIVVDGVAEVLDLAAADIEDTPDFGDGRATLYILGMAEAKGGVKILVETDRVLSNDLHGLETDHRETRENES